MENPNVTPADALARMNLMRVGSMVKPDGSKLGAENLPYLHKLREELHRFIDVAWDEIDRIERAEAR